MILAFRAFLHVSKKPATEVRLFTAVTDVASASLIFRLLGVVIFKKEHVT